MIVMTVATKGDPTLSNIQKNISFYRRKDY